jgi:hypothetical protein
MNYHVVKSDKSRIVNYSYYTNRISDKNSWPIVGEKQIDAIRDIASAHLNPFGKTDSLAAGVARLNLNRKLCNNFFLKIKICNLY